MKMTRGAVLAAAIASAITSFGAIRAVTPTAWDGDPKCWQMKRHAEKMVAVTNGGASVVFIGDSITHFWEEEGKHRWKRYFSNGPRKALNLGYSADRTEHVLWRITEGHELDGYEAKCIVLMIGTNNSGHFPFDKEPPIDTIMGVRRILDVIREKQPKARTILTAIFPRGADANDPCRRRNDVVNKEIATFADGKKVIWCDFSDKYLDAAGHLSRELFPDLLHPNARGYEIWACSVIPLIDQVLAASPDDVIASVWPSHPSIYDNGRSVAEMALRGNNYWPARYLEKRNEIVDGKGSYDVVMVGDSITHRWEREGGEGRELFAEIRKTYSILNLGYGGDKTEHVAWRMENGELEGYTAKLFTVMIGTNNGARDIAGIAGGVKRIIDDIRNKHPESKILLMPIFPRGAEPSNRQRVGNAKISDIIRGYADGKTVLWLDFNDKFLKADGTLTKEVMNDLLHPNEKGYAIWWEAMHPVFRDICGK
ncbi:MAG: hypothetical protein K6G91_06235 [Kiritimatiellae bacterium]|nr:hypothetical protein [Kiritimatiellia bacterium]